MTPEEARKILGKQVLADGNLSGDVQYLIYTAGDTVASLDGNFTADELEAIAVLMRLPPKSSEHA